MRNTTRTIYIWLAMIAAFALAACVLGLAPVSAKGEKPGDPKGKPTAPAQAEQPLAEQIMTGSPLTVTVQDDTRMDVTRLGEYQFFGNTAEGTYMWVKIGNAIKVFGPSSVPAGRATNTYTQVSNSKAGSGTPADPWRVTTVLKVPGTPLQLTQVTSYINGAEYTRLQFNLQQISASAPMTVTLFHAADLYTAGSDSGFGYRDADAGSVGDYVTRTNGSVLYQQFVPTQGLPTPNAYMEAGYSTIWNAIGDNNGPGTGFNNTIISDTLHDSGAGFQWNLTIPASGVVSVGDTDLFSGLAQLCGSFVDVPEGSFYYVPISYLACHHYVSGYTDGTFRPNTNTTRGQLAKIITLGQGWPLLNPTTPSFHDVPRSNPFYTFVETALNHHAISGYTDGTFRWQNEVTRGQIAKIVVSAKGWALLNPTTPSFHDVSRTNPFYTFIETARAKGIISGYTDNTFRWQNSATRGQLSKIVYGALTQQ